MEKGGISVNTEHIFPIIKRWLYSEKDIFIREVVSNSSDAITKHKRLISLGEIEQSDTDIEYKIEVRLDKQDKTITITDNGIGMTADELKKYINQIALSGALDFISKYEGESEDPNSSGIIGHFGLGFYSVFMVADRVELNTKSYTDAPAVHWECDEAGQFSMKEGTREGQGTELILHISDSELSYLDSHKLRSILDKYCSFMPYDIHYILEDKDEIINETSPLWQRNPSDVSDEDYKEFYKKVFNDYTDPLFWVHINADYPLNFKGVLFFPAQKSEFEPVESEIKLFYNSVFVADNIKEASPGYLLNLKGVIDCPELPLNVSRSYLQNNVYIQKISAHIAKKVSDKVMGMYNTERENYEAIWGGIKPFIEYAALRDNKFYERVQEAVLFEVHAGGYTTIGELIGEDTPEEAKTFYYATDVTAQSYYISLLEGRGETVLIADMLIDANYLQFIESKNDKLKFYRVDSDLTGDPEKKDENKKLEKLFKKSSGKEKLTVKYTSLGKDGAPGIITLSEEGRRMSDMMRAYRLSSDGSDFPVEEILTINTDAPLIKKLTEMSADKAQAKKAGNIAKHIYLTALTLSRKLTAEETNDFIKVTNQLLSDL